MHKPFARQTNACSFMKHECRGFSYSKKSELCVSLTDLSNVSDGTMGMNSMQSEARFFIAVASNVFTMTVHSNCRRNMPRQPSNIRIRIFVRRATCGWFLICTDKWYICLPKINAGWNFSCASNLKPKPKMETGGWSLNNLFN